VGKLAVTAEPSAAASGLALWAVFALLGRRVFRLRPGTALAGGLLATALHFLSEMWHQTGHARAAARAGHPMIGVHLWGPLGASVYPDDEPELPAEVHVARALGGPRTSALLAVAGAALALVVRPVSRLGFMLAALLGLENALIFTAGALLPMPFMETDGGTLRRYLRSYRKRMVVVQE
jgi:hypothetical protein